MDSLILVIPFEKHLQIPSPYRWDTIPQLLNPRYLHPVQTMNSKTEQHKISEAEKHWSEDQ